MKKATAIAIFVAALGLPSCRPPSLPVAVPPQDKHAPFNHVGRKGMVVAAHPLAAQAGLDMLKAGGNAVDAAVATAFTLNAVEPFASGIGGGGFMLIYLADEKKLTAINFREKAPAAAAPAMFSDKGDKQDEWRTVLGTAVGVPGMLAGWNYALEKYGTKRLAEAAERAVKIAESGFPVSLTFSTINKDEYEKLLKNAGETTCYLNGGVPFETGDIFKNLELAATLRLVGTKGIREFYRGEIAKKIVAAVRAKDGIMALEDLAAYKPEEVLPLEGRYKDFTIYAVPPPAAGGLHIIQLLNIIEKWPIREWGLNSTAYIHHLSEAMRFIFADREHYLGDPDFVRIPLRELLSLDYAKRVREQISPNKTAAAYPFSPFEAAEEEKENTTHVCVIDQAGNIVSLTQSINDFFGTGIVPEGTGFLLNDHMDDFSIDPRSPNAPNPSRRPVSSMGPLIIFKNGRPLLALGSPGGMRIFPSLTQIVLNIVDFGMSLDEAIESPRFFSYSADGRPRPISVESRIPEATRKALEALGHKISLKEDYDKYFGGAQGLMILGNQKIIYGGADSRRDGAGAGY